MRLETSFELPLLSKLGGITIFFRDFLSENGVWKR
jgi:hypothetical protein